MSYQIITSPRAKNEIENALDYYSLYSNQTPVNFIQALEKSYNLLTDNLFYQIAYNNIRVFKLDKFPYSLYFKVNETAQTVKILSCFHNKRDPNFRPKR
jgi:toxin ParE1/3/4